MSMWNFGASTPSATATPSLFSTGTATTSTPVGALFQTPAAGTSTTTEQPAAKQLTWTTQYEDLPPVIQQDLTKIQTRILEEKMRSDEIAQHSFAALPKIKNDVEVATERLNALLNTLQGDMEKVAEIRSNITKELKNAEVAVRYIERASANAPQLSYFQNLPLPAPYFCELLLSFDKRMEQYRHILTEITHLKKNAPKSYTPQMLQEILRNQYEAFMAAAARVAETHDEIERMKERFVAVRNQAIGANDTVEDLFEREEKRRQRQKARLMPLATPAADATPAPAAVAAAPATPAATPTSSTSLWGTTAGTGTAASTPFSLGSAFTPSTTTTTSATTPSTGTTSAFPSFTTTPAATTSTPSSLTSSLFGSSHTSSTGGLGFSTAGTALSFPTTPTPTAAPAGQQRSSGGRPATGRKGKGKGV